MTASSDDVFSLYYNPAGAMRVKRPEAGLYYGDLYPGLSDNSTITRSFLGFVYPLKNQALGVSYTRLNLNSLYSENTIGLTYSRTLWKTLSVGGTLKYYNKWAGTDFDTNNATDNSGNILPGVQDPAFKGGQSAGGWGGDLGLMLALNHGWSLGAMLENAYETDVSLKQDGSDRVPRAWKLGAARQWGDGWQGMFDLWYGRFTTEELRVRGGLEKWWHNGFGLRAGGGIGAREDQQITMGGSYRWTSWQLDYGFMMPIGTLEGSDGSHHLSLVWRWGSESQTNAVLEEHAANNTSPEDDSMKELLDQNPASAETAVPVAAETQTLAPIVAPIPDNRAQIQAQAELDEMQKRITDRRENPVTFVSGSDEILPTSDATLNHVIAVAQKYPDLRLRLEGHTDKTGSAEHNLELSQKRAEAIKRYLVQTGGIAAERITTEGFGFSRPIATNATAEGRKANRRVEFIFLQ